MNTKYITILCLFLIGCQDSDPTFLNQPALNCDQLDNMQEYGSVDYELIMQGDSYFNGECFTLFEDSEQISEIRRYKNGVKHGKWVMFFSNGQVYYIGTAKEGIIEGPFKGYYDNGQMADKGKMKNGFKDGLWKTYTRDGELSNKTLYKEGDVVRTKNYN